VFVSKKGAFLAAAAAFLAFLPSLSHGWTNFDDPMFLLNETGWRGLDYAAWTWAFASRVGSVYQPLAWLTYGLDFTLWGMDPRGYHLQSVLWHAISSGLMFLLSRRLLELARPVRSPEPGWGLDAAALLSAMVFSVHPLRVESVSWASERRDVVCCAFVLAAVWAYLKPRPMKVVAGLFFLSLLAKGMAISLPVALLALDFYPLRRIGPRGEGIKKAVLDKWPLFVLSLVFGLAGMAVQERIRWSWDQHGPLARLAQTAYAFVFYIRKTALPTGLAPLYELRPPLDPFAPRFLLSIVLVAAAAFLCRRERRSRPWLAASAFWYAVLLLPVSGLFQFGPQLVADRYSYIATLPLAVLAGALFREGLTRRREASLAAAVAVVAVLAAACVRQQKIWHDSEPLWARVLAGDPDCAIAHGSVGILRASAGRLAEAEDHFRRSLAAFPGCAEDQDRLAEGLELGFAFPEDARRLRASVETHPSCRKARANLGAVLAQKGDYERAVANLRVSVLIDPDDLGARRNLARARAELRARR
jgi:tetratricopeptide (TPR) repeat protein